MRFARQNLRMPGSLGLHQREQRSNYIGISCVYRKKKTFSLDYSRRNKYGSNSLLVRVLAQQRWLLEDLQKERIVGKMLHIQVFAFTWLMQSHQGLIIEHCVLQSRTYIYHT